ncbi:MAG: hypothetical protein MUO58_21000 [Anaerolineales bacterium]|nr:hypothetical protein [Anaerolineales bacterium]
MKAKVLSGFTILALLATLFIAVVPVGADGPPIGPPDEFPRNNMAPAGLDPMDLSVEMLGEDEVALRKLAAKIGPAAATNASPVGSPATVGEELIITVSDNGLGFDYDETFVVVLDGTNGIILIEKAAFDSFDGDNYYFPNPNGCWRPEDVISHAQLEYMLGEFDDNIYPTVGDVFGEPLARGDEGKKTWILIFRTN